MFDLLAYTHEHYDEFCKVVRWAWLYRQSSARRYVLRRLGWTQDDVIAATYLHLRQFPPNDDYKHAASWVRHFRWETRRILAYHNQARRMARVDDISLNEEHERESLADYFNFVDEYDRKERLQVWVAHLLRRLPKRTRCFIKMHYGIGHPERTLESIGTRYGITRERVRQIISNGIKKLNGIVTQ